MEGPGLRERRREETLAAIRAAAAAELAAHGAAALSLRAVAREVGMAVSALYRYYAGRDDLLTDLVVAGFEEQAEAVEAAMAAEDDPVARVRAGLWAYRSWSVANPAQFGLLYGAPVPGYVAPPRTIASGSRVGDRVAAAVRALRDAGLVDLVEVARRADRIDPASRAEFAALARRRGYDLPAELVAVMLDAFVRVHGATVMEVFGQLRPLTSRPEDYLRSLVDVAVADVLGRGDGGQTAATTSSSTTRSRKASTDASR